MHGGIAMRWTPGGRSTNIEDRRGESGGRGFGGGGGMRLGLGGTVVVLILSLIFGQDFFSLLGGGEGTTAVVPPGASAPSGPVSTTPAEEKLVQFISVVLDDAQGSWRRKFAASNLQYRDAKLVLF